MVSPYFNHVECEEEQNLYHDLANELVYLGGIEVLYISVENLESIHLDKLFLENRFEELKKENAVVLDMYCENPPANKEGDELMAKFGFSQPETCKFLCGVRHFEAHFGKGECPTEGSYIYVPQWKYDPFGANELWRINSVKADDDQFHALGSPVYFQIYTERAKYSHQSISDGEIVASEIKEDMEGGVKPPVADDNLVPIDDDDTLQELGREILEFDEKHPFGEP